MKKEQENKNDFLINKRAKIEIRKDGKRLIFTADILAFDGAIITFKDRHGVTYSFNSDLVQEMQILGGQDDR